MGAIDKVEYDELLLDVQKDFDKDKERIMAVGTLKFTTPIVAKTNVNLRLGIYLHFIAASKYILYAYCSYKYSFIYT